MAPMVKQSELPFRILCRKYNVGLCYTPMIRAKRFVDAPSDAIRKNILRLIEDAIPSDCNKGGNEISVKVDRPLAIQFCATDVESFCSAAKLVQDKCDAVDLNLGCPQISARHSGFGAFMMDKPGLVSAMVRKAAAECKVPIWCKIRMLPTRAATLKFAKMLEASGCSLLAIHARQRERSRHSGSADWEVVRDVKRALRIPVIANGNVQCLEDARACLAYTGADGVMSAQGLLANPRLFSGFGCPAGSAQTRSTATIGGVRKECGSSSGGGHCEGYLGSLAEEKASSNLSTSTPTVTNASSPSSAHCWGRRRSPLGQNFENVMARNRCAGGCLITTRNRISFGREYINVFQKFPDRMCYLSDHVVSFFRADPELQSRKARNNVDLYSLLNNPKRTTTPSQVLEILHCWEHRLQICSCAKGPMSRKQIIAMGCHDTDVTPSDVRAEDSHEDECSSSDDDE
eukprot:jgi/Bigna1/48136/estExt_Genewise1.C_230030